MPEIFSLLNNQLSLSYPFILDELQSSTKEKYILEDVMIKTVFAAESFNSKSSFFTMNDIAILCDCKIYNYEILYEELGIIPSTEYDYEVIIHLYKKYGIEYTLELLDGIYSFILIDFRLNNLDSHIYIARDPFGIKPLYILRPENFVKKYTKDNFMNSNVYAFATKYNILNKIKKKLSDNPNNMNYIVEEILPGTYSIFELNYKVLSSWKKIKYQIPYYSFEPGTIRMKLDPLITNKFTLEYLKSAIEKRCIYKNTSIILFESKESDIITKIANDYFIMNYNIPIDTYSHIINDTNRDYYKNMGSNNIELQLTDEYIESEKENINLSLKDDNMELKDFYNWWFLAKKIANDKPKSLVLLNVGIDDIIKKRNEYSWLEYRFYCKNIFKNIYKNYLQYILKIFYYFGLEVDFPWLDRNLIQYFLSNNVSV
jgi:asparagine synthase (glutamine-hydrolysing)